MHVITNTTAKLGSNEDLVYQKKLVHNWKTNYFHKALGSAIILFPISLGFEI